jgi:hypothetical protein
MQKSRDIKAFLEKTVPILVNVRLTGFGSFGVDIELLSPWVLVEWRQAVWCISREGRMWNAGDESLRLSGLEIPRKPVWRVASLFASNDDRGSLPGGVFPSPPLVPTESIENFLSSFGGEPWFGDVEEISLERRAGAELFRLRLVRGQQEFTILIQRDKYEGKELDEALGRVLEDLSREGGSHLIDATYENKIVVRTRSRLSTDAAEGSSK